MEHTNVIIKPLITEKSTHQQTRATLCVSGAGANKHADQEGGGKIYNVKVSMCGR
jgi:ribosomal protein L23